jgi:hypothetical protein
LMRITNEVLKIMLCLKNAGISKKAKKLGLN